MNSGASAGSTKQLVWAAMLGLALGACGDDGDDKGSGSSAREKCETLSTTFCDRVVECNEQRNAFGSGTEAEAYRDACERDFESEPQADCVAAIAVRATYEQCLDELPQVSCDLLLSTDPNVDPTPASCYQVIETSR